MIPKISVLTPTYRTERFFFEQMVMALESQTLKEFEWIVIDDHAEGNHEMLLELVGDKFPVIHCPPCNLVDYFAKASALNDGLCLANGKVIYFMCDYSLPQPECLARHWEIQEQFGGVMLCGHRYKVELPFERFVAYLAKEDKQDGFPYSDYHYQLFAVDKIFPWTSLGDGLFEVGRNGLQNWMDGRNDSCPLQPLLDCNGFDEIFNGAWGGEDADMAERLMTYGLRFIYDTQSACIEIPHSPGEGKRRLRSEDAQRGISLIIQDRVKNGVYKVNDQYFMAVPRDLKQQRAGNVNDKD